MRGMEAVAQFIEPGPEAPQNAIVIPIRRGRVESGSPLHGWEDRIDMAELCRRVGGFLGRKTPVSRRWVNYRMQDAGLPWHKDGLHQQSPVYFKWQREVLPWLEARQQHGGTE